MEQVDAAADGQEKGQAEPALGIVAALVDRRLRGVLPCQFCVFA